MNDQKRLARRSPVAGLRLSWRLARRTTLRGIRRSALIVALIAVPIAATTAVLTVFQSTVPSNQELLATSLGETEAVLWAYATPGSILRQEPLEPLSAITQGEPFGGRILGIDEVVPPGTEVLTLSRSSVLTETPHGRTRIEVIRGPSWDPRFEGMHQLAEGRAPASPAEAAVTRSVLERLGIGLGEQVSVVWPADTTLTVVGVMDDRTLPDRHLNLYVPTRSVLPEADPDDAPAPLSTRFFLPELALDWSDVEELNEQGYVALSRSVVLSPPPQAQPHFKQASVDAILLFSSAIGIVFAALEVVLLAGAAFSVTARQEQRTLALLASAGASPALLGRMLAFRGVLLGFVGGVAGAGLGVALAAGYIAWDSNGSAIQYYGFHAPMLHLVLFVIAATVLGWLAALVPGRTIRRMDVVAALRGSRRPPAPDPRTPRFGVIFLVLGALVLGGVAVATPLVYDAYARGLLTGLLELPYLQATLLALTGALLLLLGLGLSLSFLLRRVASALRSAGIGTRLALNDASRNAPRTTPAVAVTLVVTFVASLGLSLLGSMQAQMMSGYLQSSPTGTVYVSLVQHRYEAGTGGPAQEYYTDIEAVHELLATGTTGIKAIATIWSTASVLHSIEPAVTTDTPDEPAEQDPTPPFVAVDIPPAQLCPSDTRSPEWTPEHEVTGTDAYRAWQTDPRCRWTSQDFFGGMGRVQVSDEEGLTLILGREPDAEVLRAFRAGEAIVFDGSLIRNDTVSVSWWPSDAGWSVPFNVPDGMQPLRTQVIDAHPVELDYEGTFTVLLSHAAAERLGLHVFPTVVLARPDGPVSQEQLIELQDAALTLPGNVDSQLNPQVERGPSSRITEQAVALAAVVGLTALVALCATAIAIGLARVDAARDLATLRAVGAGPSMRRRLGFAQAFIIAGLGTGLGTLLGVVPAAVIGQVLEMPFSPPWTHLAILLIGVPLTIAIGSALIQPREESPASPVP